MDGYDIENEIAIECGIAILGQCINSKENLCNLIDVGVLPEDFSRNSHKVIYQGLLDIYSKHNEVDIVLLANELKGKVTYTEISQLIEGSVGVSELKPHIDELLRLSIKRQYQQIGNKLKDPNIDDIGKFIKKELERIEDSKAKINDLSTITTLDKVEYVDIHKAEKIRTGFREIDEKVLGFIKGSLNVITGYNANGKSTLINQMCIAESLGQGYKVFAYSPELTNSNFKSWLYPTIANEEHFIKKKYKDNEYKVIGDIGKRLIDGWIKDKLYIYSDDTITSLESQLIRDMTKLVKLHNVQVFIIDNLMKIDLEGSYKNELVAQKMFVNRLKEFARKYNVVVHLVAHPRKPQDGNKKITKFDVAGSGDITNLADYVISVSRVFDEDREKNPWMKDCIVKVMKDRPRGTSEFYINLEFDKERKRFYSSRTELERNYGYAPENKIVQVENRAFV